MRKVVIFTYGRCSRTIFSHPFLLGILSFLVFLHTAFPLIFSMLVSASPVLVCTAALLATLLSFGKPVLPEIEEERTTLKTGFFGDNAVFDRSDKGEDVVEVTMKENRLVVNEISLVDNDCPSRFEEEMYWMVKSGEIVQEERGREMEDFGFEYTSEMFEDRFLDGRTLGNQYSLIMEDDDEHLDLENAISPVGSNDSSWECVNEEEKKSHDDDDDVDEDEAESSSSDASMADIIPMLEELHPLLDEVTPQPTHSHHNDSDAASKRSDEISNESEDESEHHEHVEVSDDENEETRGVKEDQKKSAIKWTEVDQKNLKDLGTSEHEKNQRLESFIVRQRARKIMRMMSEKNLIDFDDTYLPFNVPQISTKRTSPFDLLQDSYEHMGLPPIPGSAPSLILPQRNPFALHCESSEEKPDLAEDHFDEEFVPFQPKVPIFCRHESFNMRPSFFGINIPEKQDGSRLRPYFVSERLGSEGRSYSSLTRQSSELSDSKASSVPDTDSIGSAEYMEEPNFNEEETSIMKDRTDAAEDTSELDGHGSECSEDDSLEFGQVLRRHMIVDEIDMKLEVQDYEEIEIHSKHEALDRRDGGVSSSSSLTETKEFQGFTEGRTRTEKFESSMQPSPQDSNLKITTLSTDYTPRKEPVYDSSPPASRKNLSPLSVSTGAEGNTEKILLPIMVKRSVSFSERVTKMGSQDMKITKQHALLNYVEMYVGLSDTNSLNEKMNDQNNENGDLSDSETTSLPVPGNSDTTPPGQLTDHMTGKAAQRSLQDTMQSNIGNSYYQDGDVAYLSHQYHMSGEINSLYDGLLAPEEKSMHQPLHEIHDAPQNSSNALEEFVREVSIADNLNNCNSIELEDEVLLDLAENVPHEVHSPLLLSGLTNISKSEISGSSIITHIDPMEHNVTRVDDYGTSSMEEKTFMNENKADVKMLASTIEGNLVQDVDLDLSELPEDRVEQMANYDAVLHSNGAKNAEGGSPGYLLILEKTFLDDSNAALKQHMEISSVPLRMSECGIVGDVPSEVNPAKEEEPIAKQSDGEQARLNHQEEPDYVHVVPTPEGLDVYASDANSIKKHG